MEITNEMEEGEATELEILLNDYAVMFEANPKGLEMALHAMESMDEDWQIHALKTALAQEVELDELTDSLKFWRRKLHTTAEELAIFQAKYAEVFGERALVTAKELIEGMDEATQAAAFKFSALKGRKFEDDMELLDNWNWTYTLTTNAFNAIMDSQELFEERLKRAGQVAAGNLSQSTRPVLDAVKQIGHTVQGLAISVKDIEHSSKALADTAYKEFKAKVNPDELKRQLVEGAALKLTEKLVAVMKDTVKAEMSYTRYVRNIYMLALFCSGVFLGKFIL